MSGKTIVLVLGLTVMTTAFVFGAHFTNSSSDEEMYLSNVEALTSTEGSEVVKCYCKSHLFTSNVCSANADGAYCGGDPCVNHDSNCR